MKGSSFFRDENATCPPFDRRTVFFLSFHEKSGNIFRFPVEVRLFRLYFIKILFFARMSGIQA